MSLVRRAVVAAFVVAACWAGPSASASAQDGVTGSEVESISVSCHWDASGTVSCWVVWALAADTDAALIPPGWWVTWYDADGRQLSHTTMWRTLRHTQGLSPTLASNSGGRVQVYGCVPGTCWLGQALWSRPADPSAPAQATTTTLAAAAEAAGPTAALELGALEVLGAEIAGDVDALRATVEAGDRRNAAAISTAGLLLGALLALSFYRSWRHVAGRGR